MSTKRPRLQKEQIPAFLDKTAQLDAFRTVLGTTRGAGGRQYVGMAIERARDGPRVGPESHDQEQRLYIVDGVGTLLLGLPPAERRPLVPGSVYTIPPRVWHTIEVPRALRLLSVYTPAAHPPRLVQKVNPQHAIRLESSSSDEDGDGD